MSATRHNLSAGYGRIGELTVPTDQQFVDLASLPEHVVLELDGIRFDAKKVIAALTQEDIRRQLQAFTFPTDSVIDVSQSQFSGRRTIPLYGLAKDGYVRITINKVIFNLPVTGVERYIWDNRSALAAKPTPVDLNTLPENARVQLENIVVSAHKLRQLVLKKLTGTPAENRKFQLCEVDSAEDTNLYHDMVTLESLSADGVYAIGAHEYNRDEVEQLLILNARKLSPRSPRQRLTDSVTASWEHFKTDAKAFHKKHPKLTTALLVIVVGYLLLDTAYTLSNPSNVATLNLLHYLQDPANGFTAYNEILEGISTHKQFATINLTFMAIGGWMGYHDFSGSHKYSGPIGALIGIIVSRVVQFLVVIVIAAMLH